MLITVMVVNVLPLLFIEKRTVVLILVGGGRGERERERERER